jgi:hypothetical protein
LNNWLVNTTGELGKWIEGDLLQEHYNRWLEDMVTKKGGSFDDPFYRKTLAPNVNHFLRIKEDVEAAMDLSARSKAHTSPHQKNEFHALLAMYKEDELHRYVSSRSFSHKAVNTFELGYAKLEQERISEFLKASTSSSDILHDVLQMTGVKATRHPCSTTVPELGQLFETMKIEDVVPTNGVELRDTESSNDNEDSTSELNVSNMETQHLPETLHVDIPQADLHHYDSIEDHLVSGSDYAATIDPETGVYSMRKDDESSASSDSDSSEDSQASDEEEVDADGGSKPESDVEA